MLTTTVQTQFPPGTPVRVRERVDLRDGSYQTEVFGVVESWGQQSTGSWYAHSPNNRLQLNRLRLRKADGEVVLLVVDGGSEIAKLERASS